MCPELYVQHVATYRNGESEAGYWGEVDPATHKVCPVSYPTRVRYADSHRDLLE